MTPSYHWNAEHYDQQAAFVSQFGQDMIKLLQPQIGEHILDVGCGTGDLAQDMANAGAQITGVDASPTMISRAKDKYPALDFRIADAEDLSSFPSDKYDAVFSNAALHWMQKPGNVLASIYRVLKPGGRFIAEFGGHGNVSTIMQGISKVMAEHYHIDIQPRVPWYFPTIGEYTNLLEVQGFYVRSAHHFPRPTFLGKEDQGLNHWLDQFAGHFFPDFSTSERQRLYSLIRRELAPKLRNSDGWYADYRRLRVTTSKSLSPSMDS